MKTVTSAPRKLLASISKNVISPGRKLGIENRFRVSKEGINPLFLAASGEAAQGVTADQRRHEGFAVLLSRGNAQDGQVGIGAGRRFVDRVGQPL
jgi:hypothetical protein